MIRVFSMFAERIYYLNPDLAHYLPGRAEFMAYAHVDWRTVHVYQTGNRRPRIVHAPTNRRIKGTRFVVKTVEKLRREGFEFDFALVENVKHEDAMREYEKADIVVDQLLIGWYGGLAVEVMAMGKCVVCYLREEDLSVVPLEMAEEIPSQAHLW
jgi:hypothetical protein